MTGVAFSLSEDTAYSGRLTRLRMLSPLVCRTRVESASEVS